ncbi:hypothetical protein UCDDA912_g05495 [Diaporthe ampelina]|uniref:Uncharacterized protein n=1 Tax=Diaporthe ampelina TaxID=1214573 RepID=A0A0G2FKE4_9PEZI|nr:hypothetical protein UCDDA912_g05495 [Diaporthe ampelina]
MRFLTDRVAGAVRVLGLRAAYCMFFRERRFRIYGFLLVILWLGSGSGTFFLSTSLGIGSQNSHAHFVLLVGLLFAFKPGEFCFLIPDQGSFSLTTSEILSILDDFRFWL